MYADIQVRYCFEVDWWIFAGENYGAGAGKNDILRKTP
jgi:hypothetical protein